MRVSTDALVKPRLALKGRWDKIAWRHEREKSAELEAADTIKTKGKALQINGENGGL